MKKRVKEGREVGVIKRETQKAILFYFNETKKEFWLPRTTCYILKRDKIGNATIKLSLFYFNAIHANQQPSFKVD